MTGLQYAIVAAKAAFELVVKLLESYGRPSEEARAEAKRLVDAADMSAHDLLKQIKKDGG
jgi:F0F1-type ATP synthase membrane subunit b/b'